MQQCCRFLGSEVVLPVRHRPGLCTGLIRKDLPVRLLLDPAWVRQGLVRERSKVQVQVHVRFRLG